MQFRKNRNRKKSEKAAATRLAYAKDLVGLIKDSLEIVWKTAPLALLPAGLLVWVHLRAIQWTDLFGDAAFSSTGLIFLIAAAVLMAIFLIFAFMVPSICMIGTTQMFNPNSVLPESTFSIYLAALISWIVTLAVSFGFGLSSWISIPAPMVVTGLFGLWQIRESLDIRSVGTTAVSTLGATMSMFGTAIPLVIMLEYAAGVPEYANDYPYVVIAVCILISIAGLTPGFMYLRARTVHRDPVKSFRTAAIGAVVFSYFFLAFVLAFVPVSSMILQATGIYSNENSSFEIITQDLPDVLRKAGLTVKDEGGLKTVKGYVRFSFGGIRLLCNAPYVPKLAEPAARKAASRDNKPDPRLLAGSQCVPTQTRELRRFRPNAGS